MRDMRLLVRRLADDGMTVLLSSHLLAEVEELCNRVAIVRRGRMVYEGDARGPAPRGGRRATACAPPTTSARWRVCAAQPGIEDAGPAEHGGIAFRATPRRPVGELSLALAEARALVLELAPQPRDARGPLLRAHRGRRRGPLRTPRRP